MSWIQTSFNTLLRAQVTRQAEKLALLEQRVAWLEAEIHGGPLVQSTGLAGERVSVLGGLRKELRALLDYLKLEFVQTPAVPPTLGIRKKAPK